VTRIAYPYLPEGKIVEYVSASNQWMQAAKHSAQTKSLDDSMPTGSVIVKVGRLLGEGANGSTYHQVHGCERVRLGIPTGQKYELCEGCHPKNHSEPRAIQNAKDAGKDTKGANLYLWGHWWCCEPCWNAMISAGIANVYLQEGSEVEFNKPRAKKA
jgi:dCMP deaminase